MIEVGAIRIPESELVERFVRSAGPGGQNVNKVATWPGATAGSPATACWC